MKIIFFLGNWIIITTLFTRHKLEYPSNIATTVTHWDFELFSSLNHISPLLNLPQGCQRCQKNRKEFRYLTLVRFCANIQLKWHKIQNNTKKPAYFDDFCWFWRCFCNSFNLGWIHSGQKCFIRVACLWSKCLCCRGQEWGREGSHSH